MNEYLTLTEERTLVVAAKGGDVDARNAVVMNLYHIVRSITTKQLGRRSSDREDAVQFIIGVLCEKFYKFDPDRNVRFSTYAIYWIREALHVFRVRRTLIKIPERIHRTRIQAIKGSPQTRKDNNWPFLVYRLSLEIDEDNSYHVDVVPSREPVPGHAIEQLDDQSLLRENITKLEPREQDVINRRCAGERLREIAADLGLTRERVRQIESAATTKLRKWMC